MQKSKKRGTEIIQDFEHEFFGKSNAEFDRVREELGLGGVGIEAAEHAAFLKIMASNKLDPCKKSGVKFPEGPKTYSKKSYKFLEKLTDTIINPLLKEYDQDKETKDAYLATKLAATIRIMIGVLGQIPERGHCNDYLNLIVASSKAVIDAQSAEKGTKMHLSSCTIPDGTDRKLADAVLSNWAEAVKNQESILVLRGNGVALAQIMTAIAMAQEELMNGDPEMANNLKATAASFMKKPGTAILGVRGIPKDTFNTGEYEDD